MFYNTTTTYNLLVTKKTLDTIHTILVRHSPDSVLCTVEAETKKGIKRLKLGTCDEIVVKKNVLRFTVGAIIMNLPGKHPSISLTIDEKFNEATITFSFSFGCDDEDFINYFYSFKIFDYKEFESFFKKVLDKK